MDKPDFDVWELTHINEMTQLREVNDDVSGKLREQVIEYLAAIQEPSTRYVAELIDLADLEDDSDVD